MDKIPLETTPFYFRDLTYLELPVGVSVHSREGDEILYNVNRAKFKLTTGSQYKKLTRDDVVRLLLSRNFNVNLNTLILLFLDTTNISIHNRTMLYRIPISSGNYERLTVALTGSLYDEHRTIAGVLKMRSFCVSVYNDVGAMTLTAWCIADQPHHDNATIRIYSK